MDHKPGYSKYDYHHKQTDDRRNGYRVKTIGMTTRNISIHLQDVYDVDAAAEMISHMNDKILPIAKK